MNPESWQKVKVLFDAAVELAPARRRRFLDVSCGGDEDLRAAVEELLLSSDAAQSFMELPAAHDFASLIVASGELLERGKQLGHYEIIKQIGAGGMGEVYLAEDTKLRRKVAVKVLNKQIAGRESNLVRFTREAKAVSALNHPNILVIHEIGVDGRTNYIVSEYIDGETIRTAFNQSAPQISEILDIAIQIAGALAEAHQAHIVHRDIKPENIMIRRDGYVKVLDFGLAKLVKQKIIGFENATAAQNQTAQGMIMGTVSYMSPEQAKGERVDERTDIFSLGVVIYEMIAGQTPFAGSSMPETFANLINSDPPPLSRFAAKVPDELQRIVSKTLRKNKDDRYQTMKGLLADLKDLRETVAFDAKLERSQPAINEKETAILQAVESNVSIRTAETDNNAAPKIKRHKLIAVLILTVFIVGGIGFGYYFLSARKAALSGDGKKSLAVLPFVNLSQDANAEYLSDGVTNSVMNSLSQLSSLRVMSSISAFRFKNNQADTKNIASQLNVQTLVTGDINTLGDKLIINVRLIDASDDSQIWGNQYVKTAGDIIATQNEIAQAVVQNLRLKLTDSDHRHLNKNYTENVEAYQLYLKGRYHVNKLIPTETQTGIDNFQQAINIDPNYALAYVGLANAYLSLPLSSDMSPIEFGPKAKAAIQKAVEIDDSLVEAQTAAAWISLWYDWDWAAAEQHCHQALGLDPDNAGAHEVYAHVLSNTGRHSDALREIKRAREIDPLALRINALEGQFLIHAGQPDEALDRLKKALEIAPNFWMTHLFISSGYIEKGMFVEAIAEAQKAREFSGATLHAQSFGGYALGKSGKPNEARAVLAELQNLANERYVSAYHFAMIYNGLGETEKTLEWLERGFHQHDPKMTFLKVEPKWNNLRSEPRFIDLLKRMKLE